MTRQRGFTLVELLVTLAVAALLASIAVPNFTQFLARQQAAADVNQVISAFSFARSEAVKRRSNIKAKVVPSTGGWQITIMDMDAGGKPIRQVLGSSGSVSLTPINKEVTYGALGAATNCSSPCTFNIVYPGGERDISISAAGRVQKQAGTSGGA